MASVGIDAARAFGTGCFKEHRTHDTRGMTEQELRVGSTFFHYLIIVRHADCLCSEGRCSLEEILCRA